MTEATHAQRGTSWPPTPPTFLTYFCETFRRPKGWGDVTEEATAIVREFLSRHLGPTRTKAKFHELPAGAAIVDIYHDDLVSHAKKGWRDAQDILRDFAVDLKGDWPAWLREYFIWVENQQREKARKGKRGQHPFDKLHRNEIIAAAVNFLVIQAGLQPGRTKRLTSPNPASCNRARTATKKTKASACACSIVEAALKEIGIHHMGYSNVAGIWNESCKRPRPASIFLLARTLTNRGCNSVDEFVFEQFLAWRTAEQKTGGLFPLDSD